MSAAPLPPRPRLRWVLSLAALLVSGATACVIGPKQDDPADLREIPGPNDDGGLAVDSSTGGTDTGGAVTDDVGTTPMTDALPSDAATGETATGDAATGDAATGDAAADGALVDGGCADADAADACATGGADAITGD